jgi:hypothetical protein
MNTLNNTPYQGRIILPKQAKDSCLMPFKKGGGGSSKILEFNKAILMPLVEIILDERTRLTFSPTLRGWCYLLEGDGICSKGDFNAVTNRITMARKQGLLPLDITAEDQTRIGEGGGWVSRSLETLIRDALEAMQNVPYYYKTTKLEDHTGYHIELFVEKLDLIGMLEPVTRKYEVRASCSRGWGDLHSRASLIKRCCASGLPNIIFMFGDHDIGGLSITDSFKSNCEELLPALDMAKLPDMKFIRVGLNKKDIDELGLVWIDGLETSSGKDLSKPSHPQFKTKPVQDYLKNFGARKCEANALLKNPKAAVTIMEKAIQDYVTDEAFKHYHAQRRIIPKKPKKLSCPIWREVVMINGRNKGASSEREFCKLVYEWSGVRLIRNLEQSRSGGHDLIVHGDEVGQVADSFRTLAIECKRYRKVTPELRKT